MTSDAVPASIPTTQPAEMTVLQPKNRMPFGRWMREHGFKHLFLVAVSLFALFPVVFVVSSAFNQVDSLSASSIVPAQVTLDNFTGLFENPLTPFPTWIWNSWKVSIVASVLNVFIAALAAYAFSRFRFKGRRVGLLTLLLVQVFPQFLAFIALLLLLQQIGQVFPAVGLDTHAGLILVYLGGAIGFNAFLIKGFMDTIPPSLDEAAVVDGATHWDVFWRIILPLARPVLAVIFIITFINIYSEFILARTLIQSTDNFTLPLGLQLFVSTDYNARWGAMSAAALLGALPIVTTFLVAQKQIIAGLTNGAVKG